MSGCLNSVLNTKYFQPLRAISISKKESKDGKCNNKYGNANFKHPNFLSGQMCTIRKHRGGIFIFDLYGQVVNEVLVETQCNGGCFDFFNHLSSKHFTPCRKEKYLTKLILWYFNFSYCYIMR